jgi:hypothetical protein
LRWRFLRKVRYSLLPGRYAICKLAPDATVPVWAQPNSGFCSVTRTRDELSIVCAAESVPIELEATRGWVCLKLEGPFAFTETGILSSFLAPLAENEVGILAVSTFDTDYVLIQEQFWPRAAEALRAAGYDAL